MQWIIDAIGEVPKLQDVSEALFFVRFSHFQAPLPQPFLTVPSEGIEFQRGFN